MNKRTSLIALTSLTATFVAVTAAFFSVTGIAKLFAGATLSVLIMAGALEFGKIVAISFLYQYWANIPKLLKGYLTIASMILMLITSLGIYGFLSSAYQTTADELTIMDQQTAVIELKKKRFQDELNLSMQERERLSNNIQELSRGLANNQQQYRDAQTGQILNTTSAANRTVLQRQITAASAERTELAKRIEILSDSIGALDMEVLNMNMNNEVAAEVGPLRFISNLTGWPMDKIVNIFALLIVFVFDPLAIALVIAVNFLLKEPAGSETSLTTPVEIVVDVPHTNTPAVSTIYPTPTPTPELFELLNNIEPYKMYRPQAQADTDPSIAPESPVESTPDPVEVIPDVLPVAETVTASVDDPHPEYMTTDEVEALLEKWWAKRNGRS